MKRSIITAAMAGALVLYTGAGFRLAAQTPSADAAAVKPAPRMADGHPDLSGVWWRGADVGGRKDMLFHIFPLGKLT